MNLPGRGTHTVLPAPKPEGRVRAVVVPAAVALFCACGSYALMTMLGLKFMVVALAALAVAGLLALLSFRDLSFAVIIWFVSMGSFRSLGLVTMPGLPDFSIDRVMLVWIVLVLLIRAISGRLTLRGPYLADALVIGQAVYIWLQMQLMNDLSHFHEWVLSTISPLFAFVYGKYVVRDEAFIRKILIFFFALSVYFYVTSIAEHFGITALIWPKTILNPDIGFWATGRSRGPLLHPPLFGQVLGIIGLVHFYLLARTRQWPVRLAFGISLLLTLLGVFFAYTRGPWLATAVAIMMLGVLRTSYRRVIVALGVLGVLGGMVGLMQLANSAFFQERMGAQNTVENRLGFLANAIRMIRDHPFFGIGYFHYLEKVGLYNQTSYIPLYGIVKKDLSAHVPIHDIYLGRTAEEGFVGIGLVIGFYLTILRSWISLWRRHPVGKWFNRDLLALFAGMMICYLVGGMIIDYRYFDFINVTLYFLAGIIYGYDGRAKRGEAGIPFASNP